MITDRRAVFAPFEYPQAETYWLQQQQAHWLHTEVAMSSDIVDWNTSLTDTEKHVIGKVLKGFTQTEVVVNDYWSRRVSKWFPKPEIAMMSSAFGNMETVHAKAYAYLNESLGLDDFAAFLEEPTAKAKIDALINTTAKNKSEIALSLATFSGFAEGVQLFSSFAILMNFSRFNKLKGVGQIVAFSVKDESLHSDGGCWLYRTFVTENPNLLTPAFKRAIYDAARTTVTLEDDFIDQAFSLGPIQGLDPHDLKQFIRQRMNTKLQDLGLTTNWRNIDKDALERLSWFDFLTRGVEQQDFFAGRNTGYSKGVVDFNKIDFNEE